MKLFNKLRGSGGSKGQPPTASDPEDDEGRVSGSTARDRRSSTPTPIMNPKCRIIGVAIQITLFITNGGVWVVAIIAIMAGLIIGLNTRTINLQLDPLDFVITTPATIFMTYGMLIVVCANFGCFTATGGNKWITICYILTGIFVLVFDGVFGIKAFFSTRSLLEYMRDLRGSMNDYAKEDAEPVGIFRIHPYIHWNHLQFKGQCCGLDYYDDWRNTTFGRRFRSVPDTCCNPEYEYKTCGNYIFHHPDSEHHEAQDMIYTRGCLRIFPKPLLNSFESTVYVGIILGATIIFCLLLAIVLLALVLLKKYIPGGGPEGWHYSRNSRSSQGRKSSNRSSEPDEEGNPRQERRSSDRGNRRVGPAGGDQRISSLDENEKRVSFKGTSQFIPNKRATATTAEDTDDPENSARERALLYNEEKRRNSD